MVEGLGPVQLFFLELGTLLACLHKSHANLLCIVPIRGCRALGVWQNSPKGIGAVDPLHGKVLFLFVQ